jgi:uncharacterized protein (TIGR03435 family)
MPIENSYSLRCAWKAVAAAFVFLTVAAALPAQTNPLSSPVAAAPQLSFDVVSVRQNKSGSREMTRQSSADSDGINMTNVPLFLIVFYAYHINDANLATGIPDWAMTDRYDVTAKVAPSDVPAFQKLTNTQRGQMMQPVLADRFRLQAHRETKDRPIYALVIAKGGIKMKEAKPGDTYPNGVKPNSNGFVHGATIFATGPGQITGQAASMADLALSLSNRGTDSLGRVVVDRTGLTGKYDFTLQIAPDQSQPEGAEGQQAAGSAIFTALQEQLGLKLQPATVPTEYLVIDHIEKPSEN